MNLDHRTDWPSVFLGAHTPLRNTSKHARGWATREVNGVAYKRFKALARRRARREGR
jgi:hypothetical protein